MPLWPDSAGSLRTHRRDSRSISPGRLHRSASSRIRTRHSAVNPRRVGLATTRIRSRPISLFAFGPWDDVATLLDPKGRRAGLRLGGLVCLCAHRPSPPRPVPIPCGAGVSATLVERFRPRASTSEKSVPAADTCAGRHLTAREMTNTVNRPSFSRPLSAAVTKGSRPSHFPERDRMSILEHAGRAGRSVARIQYFAYCIR